MKTVRAVLLPVLLAALATVALAGCSSDSDSDGTAAAPAPAGTPAAALAVRDPWVKTAPSGMSAVFGTILNSTGAEVTVVSATASVSPMVELHEVATVDGQMAMRPKAGGFVIPAKGSHELKPGGDHIMLMGLSAPIKPGDEVSVTLTFADGKTLAFTAVGKDFAGGNESYHPSGSPSMPMGG